MQVQGAVAAVGPLTTWGPMVGAPLMNRPGVVHHIQDSVKVYPGLVARTTYGSGATGTLNHTTPPSQEVLLRPRVKGSVRLSSITPK